MITLRNAKIEESEKILSFYQNIIDSIKGTEFKPKWSESYPNLEFIETSIEKQELYIYTEDNNVIACVVLNNRFDPEYENIDWISDAKPQEIVIIQKMESVLELVIQKMKMTMLSVWTVVDLLPVVGSSRILVHIISPPIALLMAMWQQQVKAISGRRMPLIGKVIM